MVGAYRLGRGKAKALIDRRTKYPGNAAINIIVWSVPKNKGFPEGIKYSYTLVIKGERVLGYDNSEGKGHHKHFFGREEKIHFTAGMELRKRFLKEADEIRRMMHNESD